MIRRGFCMFSLFFIALFNFLRFLWIFHQLLFRFLLLPTADCYWFASARFCESNCARLFPADDGRARRSNQADENFPFFLLASKTTRPPNANWSGRMNGWMNEWRRLSGSAPGENDQLALNFYHLRLDSEAVAGAFVCEIEIRSKTDWIFNIYHWMPLFFFSFLFG